KTSIIFGRLATSTRKSGFSGGDGEHPPRRRNTNSTATPGGVPPVSRHCAAKAAILMTTKTAAVEYAVTGVRINCISSGKLSYIDSGKPPTPEPLFRRSSGCQVPGSQDCRSTSVRPERPRDRAENARDQHLYLRRRAESTC